MKNITLIFGIVLSTLIISCTDSDTPEPKPIDLRALTPEEKLVVSSSNNFAFELFSQLNSTHEDDNMFISPFSVSTALSMTLNGANGETQTAMMEALELEDLSVAEVNEAYKELSSMLLSMDQKVTIEVANSVWYKDILNIKEAFEQILLESYDAEVKSADFEDPATVNAINSWIENKTNDKIKDMLDAIPANAVMYLINAIYFKADWTYQFDKNKTADAAFHLSNGSTTQVQTMFSEGVKAGYAVDTQNTLVDIPYGNEQFSFTVVIPHDPTSINETVNLFSAEDLTSFLSDTAQNTMEVYIPKFKIEFKDLLNETLTDMGMGIAFDKERADFSNLFDENLQLFVSRVIHQSFLEVSEEGSEAAAATIVEVSLESAPSAPSVIRIDRPFMFFIRERHTNTILFSGKLMNPSM